MLIDILFETPDLLIINKPAGLRTHGDGKSDVPTVVDWIMKERPEIAGVGENMEVDGKVIERPGIVHRLDEETSGVLVIAKTQGSFEYLKQQFKNRTVQKEYHAYRLHNNILPDHRPYHRLSIHPNFLCLCFCGSFVHTHMHRYPAFYVLLQQAH